MIAVIILVFVFVSAVGGVVKFIKYPPPPQGVTAYKYYKNPQIYIDMLKTMEEEEKEEYRRLQEELNAINKEIRATEEVINGLLELQRIITEDETQRIKKPEQYQRKLLSIDEKLFRLYKKVETLEKKKKNFKEENNI